MKWMTQLGWWGVITMLLSACNGGSGGWPSGKCGSYTLRAPSIDLEDSAIETCTSTQDSWGSWDLLGDGNAFLWLDPSEYDDSIGWFEVNASFPNAWLLEVGETFEVESAAGFRSWRTGEPFDWVGARIPLELTILRIGTDYDDIWQEAYIKIRWKGEWGDPTQGPYYTAEGEDWLGILDAPDIRTP